MTLNEYQALAQRTSPNDGHDRMDNAMLGLIGETGEIIDVFKKYIYQSSPETKLPTEKFAEEIGDVMWYMAELAAGMEARIGDIAGNSFSQFDKDAARRCGTTGNLRREVTKMHRCADMICIAIEKNAHREQIKYMRRMISRAARLACMNGYTLEEVCRKNIQKLQARYPEGFDARASMRRYER